MVSLLTCSILYELRCSSVYNYSSWYHYWRAAYCMNCAVLLFTTTARGITTDVQHTVWIALFFCLQLQLVVSLLTCSILYELRCSSVYNYSSWYHYWRAAYCMNCAVLLFTTTARGITTDVQHTVWIALFFCLQLQLVVSLLTCSILYELRCSSVYNYSSWYHYWRAAYCMKCAVLLFTTTARGIDVHGALPCYL